MSLRKTSQPALFHPVLLGLYPVLALLSSNIAQTRPLSAARSAVVCLVGAVLVHMLARALMRGWQKGALAASWFLLLFYSYGHLYGLLEGARVFGFDIGRHLVLAPVWLLLLVAGEWWVWKTHPRAFALNRLLNGVSVILVLLPLLQIGWFGLRVTGAAQNKPAQSAQTQTLGQGALPDVYYIILDGYTRADILQRDYSFDNTPFLDDLRDLGFVIPDCAQSNYAYTALAVSSTLHMDYLENFTDMIQKGDEKRDYPVYQDLIAHSPVRDTLTGLGYKMAAFETGFWWDEVTDAEFYIVANNNPLEKITKDEDSGAFEALLLRTTLLRPIVEASAAYLPKLLPGQALSPEQKHYNRLLFTLDQMERLPEIEGRKFVYAHLLAPHKPFVLGQNGEYQFTTDANMGYPDQIRYVNQRILGILKNILAKSQTPPVIILQGDHGWDKDRMAILSAFYLPAGGEKQLYPGITPVNYFRVILNQYFGENYPFLPDVSYYSVDTDIYQFSITPNTCLQAGVK